MPASSSVDGDDVTAVLSSWGDFDDGGRDGTVGTGVRVLHAAGGPDLLSGTHDLATAPLPLPTSMSSWDPGLTRIDGRWHLGFVQSPSQRPFHFHPALAVGSSGEGPLGPFTLVGADTALLEAEGPVLSRVGPDWLLLAADAVAREHRVYDLAMTGLGRLDATFGSNIPHPQLVADRYGRTCMITFDGTGRDERRAGYGTHGDLVLLRDTAAAG